MSSTQVSHDARFTRHERANSSVHQPFEVERLPDNPQPNGYYTFRRISRGAVTGNNHDLHKYPAKFIPQLPEWALRFSGIEAGARVLDPFCGSGTTLIEAGLKGSRALGRDISPLAITISAAKTSLLECGVREALSSVRAISLDAQTRSEALQRVLEANVGKHCLGVHATWSNWFRARELSELLALRDAITESADTVLRPLLFAVLSAIVKSASYLNEDQIKVRFEHGKVLANVHEAFSKASEKAIKNQVDLSAKYRNAKASFDVHVGCAGELDLQNSTIDCVVTSPPYVNAVDYTMNQKYNSFVLGIVDPADFKSHCRDYIGMTERAVRSHDLREMKLTGDAQVDSYIEKLWAAGDSVSRNRAYILHNYFDGMLRNFKEVQRVLVPGGSACYVVGTSNRIRHLSLPTDELLLRLALAAGLQLRLRFYHVMANRSSMRLARHRTGGEIPTETIFVFEKSAR
jgi:tRNA G10  N-methylase Trm11